VYSPNLRNKVSGLGLLLMLGFSLVTPLRAQQYLGTLNGSVADSTGAKVVGAAVTAKDLTTNFVSKGVTNGEGAYTIPFLTPDVYTITVTAKDFRVETRTGITLTSGATAGIDFALTPGTQTESVIVTANSQLLDSESPALATTITGQQVSDLPNNGRDPNVLATLTVGVINGGSGGYFQGASHNYTNPFSGVAVQITTDGNGGHNRLTLDGIPNDPPERLSGVTYAGFTPSPESVQEVKVSQGIFDAQVGHGGGTVTDVILRSGTSSFHGAAYYVFQNTYLNANTSQNTHNGTPRGNDQLSQTGFVFDGPVKIPHVYDGRDKTHFMVAYERYHSHSGSAYSSRMPTPAELAGDFSGLCSAFNSSGLCTTGTQLYMPNSAVDADGNRTQYFAYNNIASAIATSGTALASYYPAPNVPGYTATSTVNYQAIHAASQSNYPSLDIRIDHQISAKDTIYATYFTANLTQSNPLLGFPKGITTNGGGDTVIRNTHGGSLDEIHVFSSSFVLDSRFGVTNHPFGLIYPGNANFDLGSLGISGSYPYSSFPGATLTATPVTGSLNTSNVTNTYASLAPGAGGQVSTSTLGSLNEIATKNVKTHTVRFGFEGDILRYDQQNPESGFGNGSSTPGFYFDNRFTQRNVIQQAVGTDASSGDAFADLLLGDFSSTNYTAAASFAMQQIYYAPWVQDDWRVNHKLTVNLGLRWDVELPYTERYNKLVTAFCTTCVNPLQASVTGLPLYGGLQYAGPANRYPFPANYKAIQPRLGLAYQAARNTVIHAGYGLIYFNTFESPISTGFTQNTSYNNYVTSAPINSLSNPYPNGVALPTGSAQGLSTALGQNVSFVDPNHVQPRSAEFTLNVQQQFPGSLVVQVGYVGARPTHIEVNHNINLLPAQYYNQGASEVTYLNAAVPNPLAGKIPQAPGLNGATIAQNLLLLPYPEFGSVTEQYSPIGSQPYNALQITVTKPMTHHFTIAGNMTWQKIMDHTGYLDNYAGVIGKLDHLWDQSPSFFGNIYGTYELPKFDSLPIYGREVLGGWKLNGVMRYSNGQLLNAPGNVDIIGNYKQPHWTLHRQYNTCYENTAGIPVNTVSDPSGTYPISTACDSTSPTPAFIQRLAYTSQTNSNYLNIRQQYHPLLDASLFKQFAIRDGVSFEIRGEFFNVLNTPIWGSPGGLGASNAGSSSGGYSLTNPTGFFSQANDPRIGQLTARINF
jgi:Carboxypeptidase regulatory-like domain